MEAQTVLSCYLLRIRQQANALEFQIQDLRSGEILCFEDMEVFLSDLSTKLEAEGVARAPPNETI
ncbi:MAG: hypothetical protein ACK41E_06960 [Deinococcales bacterium]